MAPDTGKQLPVQPVDKPIICNPYEEPRDHWRYDSQTGAADRAGFRRPAGYWYKTQKTGAAQRSLFAEEERDDLPLVNLLREDVRRWREADYRGATSVTKDLLRHWSRADLTRRLFFCQREAVETIIYLAELRIPNRSSRTGFKNFSLDDDNLRRLLHGEKPTFELASNDYYPSLIDKPFDDNILPLRRLGCKMATGSGKTIVMAMLITWAFCNRNNDRNSRLFPGGVLICCPNLTVKERLQVLRPENPDNYYKAFDLVPSRYSLGSGKVLIENWHQFAPESEHVEGGKSYAVVEKGFETPETFAKRVLGDLYDRLPIMVMNDEGHHCWRPAPVEDDTENGENKAALEDEKQEATVWVSGLDRINNVYGDGRAGISMCVDLSATPFYISGSGYPEGRPFPWLVSDFGLVDAIESGIVKIPRLPVQDTTGRPDPRYFRLWDAIKDGAQPAERLPGKSGRLKPDVVYREVEPALKQIAGQWVERFELIQKAKPGQENLPPVLIVVCDSTDVAEIIYRKISGEEERVVASLEDIEGLEAEDAEVEVEIAKQGKRGKPSKVTVYGRGSIFPEYFSNTPSAMHTVRIDTKLLAEAESEDSTKSKQTAAEELRKLVSTVGKRGEPGEHVRCVVSVSMLTEGWDANNVTQILGIRAFGSQLLCEQVVGRGLRRMDYDPDPETGLLTAEYVDVYGIPFSVIPFKGRATSKSAPEDKPKNHVRALDERAGMEIRFPVVEGYIFDLRKDSIRWDFDTIEPLVLEPNREPTATFVQPTVGYRTGHPSQYSQSFAFKEQNRDAYYNEMHTQTINFQITKMIVDELVDYDKSGSDAKRRVLALQSRFHLFPQVHRLVQNFVEKKVDYRACHPCELGLEKYVQRTVERLLQAIQPDDSKGEAPLLPVLNRYKPIGTSSEIDFKTTRPTFGTARSHVNQVVADTQRWEQSAAFRIEQSKALHYVRNDHLGFVIPYQYMGVDHSYEPDFLIRLKPDFTLILEVKGYEDEEVRAKHAAARRWVDAVNNWGQLGKWDFHVCRDPQVLEKELDYLATSQM